MRKTLPLFALLILLAGCPKKAQFEPPPLPVPDAWPASSIPSPVAAAPPGDDVAWRDYFSDPKLQAVIALALEHNRDLRAAALNIDKVRALYRIQRAELYPTVAATASSDTYRIPGDMNSDGEGDIVSENILSVGVSAWEMDFFGRIRSLKAAALEQYLATEQARSATQVALVAAVAQSYLALAANRQSLGIAGKTLEAQTESYQLIEQSQQHGVLSGLEVSQARSQVQTAQLDRTRHTGQSDLDRNALELLVGAPVPADLLPDDLDTVGAMKEIAAGLPSEILLSRPDIRLAEHRLKAAEANIEAARAAFFPRISLTAGIGLVSGDLADLFKLGSGTWNFAPLAVLPLFDSGARQANYDATRTDREIAVAEYEKAIQTAFREVSDALSQRATLLEQEQTLQALVETLDETYRLAEARYKAGIDSYLGVLVAQRSLYAAQQRLVEIKLARQANLVTLYKVLGGGAEPAPAPAPLTPGGSSAGPTPVPAGKQ